MANKVLIVAARFYQDVSDELLKGATSALEDHGIEYDIVDVPGAFEIPAAIRFALKGGNYDGFVALGCVIRGETSHYDYVCTESIRGLQTLAVSKKLAVGNGILTVENMDQALERASVDKKNKGRDFALTTIRMMELKKTLGKKSKK